MIYADYSYYTDSFYGEMIPEEDYPRCAMRASDYLDRLTMNRVQDHVILHPTDERVKKATCACAEQYFQIFAARAAASSEDGEIASETVGGHSVSYRSGLDTAAALESELRKIAESYLATTGLLYRGIAHVHAAHCYTDFS